MKIIIIIVECYVAEYQHTGVRYVYTLVGVMASKAEFQNHV